MKNLLLGFALGLSVIASAEPAKLAAGPMVGYSTMREVTVWVQTESPAEVAVEYWAEGSDKKLTTQPRNTIRKRAHTAHLVAEDLTPATTYRYRVLLDGAALPGEHLQRFTTQPLWHWRNDAPDFRFALGTCAFINEARFDRPGKPYGGGYEIFERIADQVPAFMLWMGDNVYLREADWNSRSGIYSRYSHTRATPKLQRLLAGTHHYAIWDDHDYGPDNSNRTYPLKQTTQQAFKDFWANPNYNATGSGGLTGTFEWHDTQFFLLDNRWFRSANGRQTGEPQIFGAQQIDWLIDSLKSSKATFKFIVTAGLFINDVKAGESHYYLAPQERKKVIDLITKENVSGVIFLNGDIHHSQLSKLDRRRNYPLYEWTVSPLTAGTYSPVKEMQTNRVPDSRLVERNFGVIEVTGPAAERQIKLSLHDTTGTQRWEKIIQATELKRR